MSKQIARFVAKLEKLATEADQLELTLPNGALVDNLLMGIAIDVNQMLKSERPQKSKKSTSVIIMKPRGEKWAL